MTISIRPYTEIDGIRTYSDSEIKELFERTVRDGLDRIVFYEGTVQTAEQFLNIMKSGSVLFYALMSDGEIIGYTWLNRFENHTARMHFCVFQEYWGKTLDIGKFVLDKIMHMKDLEGNYIWDLLTGFVPAWNKRAINFALKCGGQSHGKIPNAIWNQEKQQSEDAVFIYYTREAS